MNDASIGLECLPVPQHKYCKASNRISDPEGQVCYSQLFVHGLLALCIDIDFHNMTVAGLVGWSATAGAGSFGSVLARLTHWWISFLPLVQLNRGNNPW